ncbi:MAG: ABC-2 type transport system permease protein [Glaciecola sp.]|jgi:ABC-2 type transport system permease protein
MNKIGIIIKREFLTRVKKKSFIVMTFLGPLLFIGFMAAAFYISQSDTKIYNVLMTDTEGLMGKVLMEKEFKDGKYVKYHFQSSAMSNEQFKNSEYDLLLDLNPKILEVGAVDLYYKSYPGLRVQGKIENQVTRNFQKLNLLKHNVSIELYELLKTKINIKPVDIERIDDASPVPTELGFLVGLVLSIMIFMFIMLYGQQIMRGVLEEKTSRIVEVIVSSVKPFTLMMGKVIGVALVGLTQFLMWVALSSLLMSLATMFLPDIFMDTSALMEQQMTPEMQEIMINEVGDIDSKTQEIYSFIHRVNFPFIIGMFIFYFLGGYLLFGSLYAAIGAAVDVETDSQQFMVPIIMPLMLGYFIAVFGMENPESSAMYWGSIIPFTSPIVMMVKVGAMGMGFEPIDWPLILTSMGLLIVAFVSAVWVAGKIYKAGILFHGKKVGYKDLWKWLRYS